MSLLNGLAAMGQGIAQFAGGAAQDTLRANQTMDLLAIKNQNDRDMHALANQFQTDRDTRQNTFTTTESQRQEGVKSREAVLADQRLTAREAAQARLTADLQSQAPTPEIKNAKWWANASEAERKAFRDELLAKSGVPDFNPPTDLGGSSGGTAPSPPTTSQPSDTGRNDKALEGVPAPLASIVKGMVEGRISPPTSFAMAKPYWQTMMAKAAEYDPTFDQTTWAGRVAMRKDEATGKFGQAKTAANTAMMHAGTLMEDFEKLNNFGGVGTLLNGPVNAIESAFGDARQTKAKQTVTALASEARKVFAASGGGNLTELLDWEKSFPINGSPSQQKAALIGFVDLLDGRLHSMADQRNLAMGKTDDPINLLEGKARKVYERLTGRESEGAVGYQTGKPPTTATGPRAAASTQDAEAGVSPLPMPKSAAEAVAGRVYNTSRGPARWDGTQFMPVP